MKILRFNIAFILLLICITAKAQILQWENSLQLQQLNNAISSVASDRYGQHILIPTGAAVTHYLVGNDGIIIPTGSPSIQNDYVFGSSITCYAGKTYIATAQILPNPLSRYEIRLYRSDDDGTSWTLVDTYDPTPHSPIPLLVDVDMVADQNGVHIVWSRESARSVYYVRRDAISGQWEDAHEVTGVQSILGAHPKVCATATKVVISFVTTNDGTNRKGTTLDLNLTNHVWDTDYRQTSSLIIDASIGNTNLGIRGGNVHVVMTPTSSGDSRTIWESQRNLNGTWSLPQNHIGYDYGSSGEWGNQRRKVTSIEDTLYTVFSKAGPVGESRGIMFGTYKTDWSALYNVATYSGNNFLESATISSSATGVYVFWYSSAGLTPWMARLVMPMKGIIKENAYWTGHNYVTDNLTIQSGVRITLKTGSITYVSDNKKIIVEDGATFVQEPGSQLIFGTGAKFQLSTGVRNLWNLTGIPVVVPDPHKAAVYPTATSDAFAFNDGYEATDPLTNDRGWFIKFGSDQSITYEGDFIGYTEMDCNAGWNIIGSISSPIATQNVDPIGVVISLFYRYDNGGYVAVDTLRPGGGYWVKATGHIILDVQSNNVMEPDPELETYDKFTLTDAAGSTQDLYVRNGTIVGSTDNIEMPPAFPDAPFDVRFSSGDYVRTVIPDSGEAVLSIDLNEVVYPVQLSWEIQPENGITYSIIPDSGLGRPIANLNQSETATIPSVADHRIRLTAKASKVRSSHGFPTAYVLSQNYPNPFNPETRIHFELSQSGPVRLVVYDLLGREVATLVDEFKGPGRYDAKFNAASLASGVYFYRLQAGGFVSMKKMLLMK